MTENNYTLTLNLNFDTLQYMTKFHELFENAHLYENGLETLENIKSQLNTLKNVETGPIEPIDMDDVGVGYGPISGQNAWDRHH